MHDQIAVRVRDGREYVEEQPDALFDIQAVLIAIRVDALAAYVFEDEVRLSIPLDTGIEQSRDVRMLQAGEHAALARKALLRRVPDESEVQQLDRDLSFESAVAAMCEPHGAHAAEAENPIQRVRAEALPFQAGRQMTTDRVFEELAIAQLRDLPQARPDVRSQLRCAPLEIFEP